MCLISKNIILITFSYMASELGWVWLESHFTLFFFQVKTVYSLQAFIAAVFLGLVPCSLILSNHCQPLTIRNIYPWLFHLPVNHVRYFNWIQITVKSSLPFWFSSDPNIIVHLKMEKSFTLVTICLMYFWGSGKIGYFWLEERKIQCMMPGTI